MRERGLDDVYSFGGGRSMEWNIYFLGLWVQYLTERGYLE